MAVKASSVKLQSVIIGHAASGVPTITSFSPTSGAVADSVTITGTNLSGTTDVKINGTSASSLSGITSTSVTAVVGSGSTTGIITVVTPAGTANTSLLTPSVYTVSAGGVPTYTLITSSPFTYFYNDPSGPPFHGIGGVIDSSTEPTNVTLLTPLQALFTTGTGTTIGGNYSQSPFFSWVCEMTVGPVVTSSRRFIGIHNNSDTFDPNIVNGSNIAPYFAEDGSAYIEGVLYVPGTYPTWGQGDVFAIAVDFNSSLMVAFLNGTQIYDLQIPYASNTHNTTYTMGVKPTADINITQFDFNSYTTGSAGFTIQKLPFGQPAHPGLPYTWNPSTDMQFLIEPGGTMNVTLTFSGAVGAVNGVSSVTTTDGEYTIENGGQQSSNTVVFVIFNNFSSPSTIPEPLTFTIFDSIGNIGTYTIMVTDIVT